MKLKDSSTRSKYAVGLIAVAIPIVGFQVNLLTGKDDIFKTSYAFMAFDIMLLFYASLTLLAISPLLGLSSGFIKFIEKHYDVLRIKMELENKSSRKIRKFVKGYERYEEYAMNCFGVQVSTFAMGCMMLGCFYFWRYIA
ncbi:MAG: hypothetical protein JST43_12085 [Bacteroidetes bacterium]|nr:hypothetical protein [Bacteroidota bacterium]MBS1541383.1 hypothetical protein [Bacteroidota bacterium]